MKTIISILTVTALLVGMTSSTNIAYPTIQSKSFTSGEKLTYRISYGIMDAGEAVLTVKETKKKGANGRPLYHVKGEGKTLGAFNWFYKVEDVYESYVDKKGVFPWLFLRDINEGGYEKEQEYVFQQNKQKVVSEGKSYKVPLGVQDMISSFYYARTLDFKNMKVGEITEFKCFMDEEVWPLKVKYVGKEDISIRKGTFECMKFQPVVQEGRYFEEPDDVEFWVTNDENRIPVLVKAKIPVGSIKMHLVEWEGLVGDIAIKD
ncbi:DUF3108 domain-containing protein [Brumimicrobium aurantiacum]|uniref:DUF3108 domain-containing protein n=1 Tax=Brumimicrobium aurantiacum TaxID=1737063 RepID=A0A3E1F2G5_9FLAO|nr:DUF3108 domain-containing protein [Brumimicrobium aurantiacum]RFC55949.1 DUF3108 domain-containing protein [Brumimicrobium aurantiacum]